MTSPDSPESDRAIIAGIGRYRDGSLAALRGAREDAKRFYDWVVSKDGGCVPRERVHFFWKEDDTPDAAYYDLRAAFVNLAAEATKTPWLGRRLYIYLAGHGVSQDPDEASVFAADGGPSAEDRHIPGWCYARWFRNAAFFDEVVLFADCCRSQRETLTIRPFTDVAYYGPRAGDVRWIRGFAAAFGQSAIERTGDDARGVFTDALLDALKHAGDEKGQITSSAIRIYLENHPKLATLRGRMDPKIEAGGGKEIVFGRVRPEIQRRLIVGPTEGTPIVRGGPPQRRWEPRSTGVAGEYVVDLVRGIYKAEVAGRKRYFEVTGNPEEGKDVSI